MILRELVVEIESTVCCNIHTAVVSDTSMLFCPSFNLKLFKTIYISKHVTNFPGISLQWKKKEKLPQARFEPVQAFGMDW